MSRDVFLHRVEFGEAHIKDGEVTIIVTFNVDDQDIEPDDQGNLAALLNHVGDSSDHDVKISERITDE